MFWGPLFGPHRIKRAGEARKRGRLGRIAGRSIRLTALGPGSGEELALPFFFGFQVFRIWCRKMFGVSGVRLEFLGAQRRIKLFLFPCLSFGKMCLLPIDGGMPSRQSTCSGKRMCCFLSRRPKADYWIPLDCFHWNHVSFHYPGLRRGRLPKLTFAALQNAQLEDHALLMVDFRLARDQLDQRSSLNGGTRLPGKRPYC